MAPRAERWVIAGRSHTGSTDREQEVRGGAAGQRGCGAVKPQAFALQPRSSSKVLPPEGSMAFPQSTTILGPCVQVQEPIRDISHVSHYRLPNQNNEHSWGGSTCLHSTHQSRPVQDMFDVTNKIRCSWNSKNAPDEITNFSKLISTNFDLEGSLKSTRVCYTDQKEVSRLLEYSMLKQHELSVSGKLKLRDAPWQASSHI